MRKHDKNHALLVQLMRHLKCNHIEMTDYPDDICIVWTSKTYKGLPIIRRGHHSYSLRKQLWIAIYHEEPDGLLSTHCQNRFCVNPHHICYIQSLTTHCPHGHQYTPANTRWRVRKDKRETKRTRECRTCYVQSKHRTHKR